MPSAPSKPAGPLHVEGAEMAEHGAVQWLAPPERERGSYATLGSVTRVTSRTCHVHDIACVWRVTGT